MASVLARDESPGVKDALLQAVRGDLDSLIDSIGETIRSIDA